MRSKRLFLAIVLAVLILSTTACSGELTQTVSTDPKDLVEREVVLSEYKIEPAQMKVPTNAPVRFIVKNDGLFTHEFRVMVDPAQVIEVAPKSEDRLDVVFDKPGVYKYLDAKSDNEKRGMKGTLTVEAIN